MSQPVFRVVGLCGSLRAKSMNAALLRYAATTFPSYVRYDEANTDLPLYNEDLEVSGRPPAVKEFAALVAAADGVLLASCEYNYGYSGVLKNAIDWASRAPRGEKPGSAPLMNKPFAILGGSYGMMGSGRAQYPLRQSMVFLGGQPVIRPEIFVRFTDADLWDEEGRLKHESTKKIIAQLTGNLVDHLIVQRQREETLKAFKAKLNLPSSKL
jgi:chromate reductase